MTTLYFKDSVSDKVYLVTVDPDGGNGLYNVNFSYGRRGGTMSMGQKNTSPLPLHQAQALADKVIREKMAKGYTVGEDGTPYKNTNKEERTTTVLPMLLSPIREDELGKYIEDDNWAMQEKYDGRRIMMRKKDNTVEAINRSGLLVGAPVPVLDEVMKLPNDFILDGELIGDYYYVFDLIEDVPFSQRIVDLDALFAEARETYVVKAITWTAPKMKSSVAAYIKASNGEGVVFKLLTALYQIGRPASNIVAIKCKFTHTVSVRVSGINFLRSVRISLADGTPCGNVSIPTNKEIPEVGNIIEVRYLYAMPSGFLFQPVFLGVRDDIKRADTSKELSYKQERND